MGSKKHKKHKSERRDRYEDKQFGVDKPPALKLIFKVGSSSTPEHSSDSPGPATIPLVHSSINYSVAPTTGDEESRHSTASFHARDEMHLERQHKKAKKKKKKKEKDKDRDKHEKKHKHHHKEKRKRPREESSQDDVSMGEESLSEPPLPKRAMIEGNNVLLKSALAADSLPIHVSTGIPGQGHLPSSHVSPTGSGGSREPRSCVLRQRQERTALQKLLDYLLKGLEKKDPQQFFAWPVTDNIAPGYSQIISQPMDFSTMKQKVDENQYPILNDFIDDFKLMCSNAMAYNHPETIYYKAAKKLLHVGVKAMTPDKLKLLRPVVTYMGEISRDELGFDLGYEEMVPLPQTSVKVEPQEEAVVADVAEEMAEVHREHRKKNREASRPLGRFEAIPDDLSPHEILVQAQRAAKAAADRLSLKQANSKMGFLRQRKDGSTSLAILIPGNGVTPGTNEQPVSLGVLTGKLAHGTGQLQGFREDRRNLAKTVKPLYYGAFGSYAPSYDSTFANLTKEESDLVYQTYGDETAVQYAESILDFSKDCDYTLTMVDNLLDLLTGGEHRRSKKVLDERRRMREEEQRVQQLMEAKPAPDNKLPPVPAAPDVKIDLDSLRGLADLGLDMSFIDAFDAESAVPEEPTPAVLTPSEEMQCQLNQTSDLLQKLQQVQSDRLSLPPPAHLSLVAHPSDGEMQLAEKITARLKDMSKKVPPGAIASMPAIRKAMGIISEPVASPRSPDKDDDDDDASPVPEEVDVEGTSSQAEHDDDVDLVPDLESELREFLESEPALSNSPLHDDKTIEEILSES